MKNELPESYNKELCAAFTGHRLKKLPFGGDEKSDAFMQMREKLRESIFDAYGEGKRYFLSGMADGVDTYAAELVLDLKNALPGIKLVCVYPYPPSFERQKRIGNFADCSIVLSDEYTKNCFHIRDNFLIEHSSLLIAVFNGVKAGGTYYTMNAAKRAGIRIIEIPI